MCAALAQRSPAHRIRIPRVQRSRTAARLPSLQSGDHSLVCGSSAADRCHAGRLPICSSSSPSLPGLALRELLNVPATWPSRALSPACTQPPLSPGLPVLKRYSISSLHFPLRFIPLVVCRTLESRVFQTTVCTFTHAGGVGWSHTWESAVTPAALRSHSRQVICREHPAVTHFVFLTSLSSISLRAVLDQGVPGRVNSPLSQAGMETS